MCFFSGAKIQTFSRKQNFPHYFHYLCHAKTIFYEEDTLGGGSIYGLCGVDGSAEAYLFIVVRLAFGRVFVK